MRGITQRLAALERLFGEPEKRAVQAASNAAAIVAAMAMMDVADGTPEYHALEGIPYVVPTDADGRIHNACRRALGLPATSTPP